MKEVPFSSPPSCLREIERWHTHSLAINLRNEETRVKDLSLERRDGERQTSPYTSPCLFSLLLSLVSQGLTTVGREDMMKRGNERERN